ncbi:MAG: HAMP domain-containing histidine kinase [bacterium]|nr:HAMP domain-containing histidine kinase [bacterium]
MTDSDNSKNISGEEYKTVTEELYKQNLEVVKLYKQVEKLNADLEKANDGQATLIHFINHQIKGYFFKARSIFAELEEDEEYGPINDAAKIMIKTGADSLKEGVDFVQDILKAANIEKGTMVYNMESLDFRKIVSEMADDQKKNATDKGLEYTVDIKENDYQLRGDNNQLKEAVRNLINNSISYTPYGSIYISLNKINNKIVLSIKDTGVGLSEEVKPKLFTKGGRDKESQKINVNSTGFGLSIVKGVIDAHHGRVWAESEGQGKGSAFTIELPVA